MFDKILQKEMDLKDEFRLTGESTPHVSQQDTPQEVDDRQTVIPGSLPVKEWHIVEKHNPNALHGIFHDEERAKSHLKDTIPDYCTKGFFTDKTLKPSDFTIKPIIHK